MAFRLRRDTIVAGMEGNLKTLDKGTLLEDISDHEKLQLAPGHFIDDSDPDERPEDWRDADVQLRDELQNQSLAEHFRSYGGTLVEDE